MRKSIFFPSLMAMSFGIHADAAPRSQTQTISQRFDFAGQSEKSFEDFGVEFFFSDVPADQVTNGRDLAQFEGDTLAERLMNETRGGDFGPGNRNFYQLTQIYDRMDEEFSGQAIGYSNRSDDTDVNLQMVVGETQRDRLKPLTTYLITAKLEFVSKANSSGFGVGGSPDSNSFGLAVSQYPWVAAVPGASIQPIEPTTPDAGANSYYGIAGSFFIDSREISERAVETLATLNEVELQGLGADDEERLEALKALYASVLAQLPRIDESSDLSRSISEELDQSIKAKLDAMSEEDKEQLKAMFGAPSEPFEVMSETAASSDYIRTSTRDSKGRSYALGVPSGRCNGNIPLAELSENDRFICERYSYMGRINNGSGGTSDAWAQNSITTSKPLEFTTDAQGSPIYLNLTSHSGFEGLTVYYVTGIEYRLVEKK